VEDRYPLMKPYNLTKPFFSIKIKGIGIGVKILIKNVGKETAYDVNWNITIIGDGEGFLNKHREGSAFKPFKSGDEKKFRFYPIGYGYVDIEITVDASNTATTKIRRSGIIILCFFIQY